jgi:hypothetical protein
LADEFTPVLTRVTAVLEVHVDDLQPRLYRDRRRVAGRVDAVRIDLGGRAPTPAEEIEIRALVRGVPHVQVVGSDPAAVLWFADSLRRTTQQDHDVEVHALASPPRVPRPAARAISAETTALLLDQAHNPDRRPTMPPQRPAENNRQENDT